MSRASKITLTGTSLFAITTVAMVHWQQEAERDAMHQGVVRDMEQIRVKKERQLDFDMQRALEEEYKKSQSVHDAIAAAATAEATGAAAAAPSETKTA